MDTAKDSRQTPMMQQFYRIKQEHPDKILFYRMGDFYEMFGDDAVKAAEVLQIQLTSRNKNKDDSVPLCGIPVHAYEQYLNKLTRAGFKVAVCEQTEDPAAAKGLVKREVVRIVTPGTVIAPDLLEAGQNSFLCSISANFRAKQLGIAFCDLTTGEFEIDELDTRTGCGGLMEMLHQYRPREILMPCPVNESETRFNDEITQQVRQLYGLAAGSPHFEYLEIYQYEYSKNIKQLKDHFAVESLSGFGVDGLENALCAAGAVLTYLKDTQKDALFHINSIRRVPHEDRMLLDESTVRNLELLETAGGGSRKHTLIHLLDNCRTAMGSRRLRRWMLSPLKRLEMIEKRLEQVAAFLDTPTLTDQLRAVLSRIGDLERLIARISMPAIHIGDLVKLRDSLEPLSEFREILKESGREPISRFSQDFDDLRDIWQTLRDHILPEPALKVGSGGYIMPGVDERLDQLKNLMKNGKQLIANMEAEERRKTGISSLKIGYNRVFGYFIDVSNAYRHLVPDHYIRKQTLVNNERYVTESLKELEENILTAEEESIQLEMEILESVKNRLQKSVSRIQKSSRTVSRLDVISTFANNAAIYGYTRPELKDNSQRREMDIREGRHPVIESLSFEEPFIPNDVSLDSERQYVMVITGPNMGGKSTYMRQTALIALMAQMGSFVPARSAVMPVFDRIFTRVGASDNLTRGQSTFMVEMSEAASILNNATGDSLIILDEIGRGTSTFDGISIAWSIIEYIHRLGALTLFATHYHELTLLEEQLQGVRNAKVVVREDESKLIFLRKVITGQTDQSYGIQVARLAGLPVEVVERAEEVVQDLKTAEKKLIEKGDLAVQEPSEKMVHPANIQLSFFPSEPEWISELKSYDINSHSPLETVAFLDRIKKKVMSQ